MIPVQTKLKSFAALQSISIDRCVRRITTMVTARDEAIHARVSVATVSRVLMAALHVTPEKRQKMLSAVQELDYRPDKAELIEQ